jgi:hypothetical protein
MRRHLRPESLCQNRSERIHVARHRAMIIAFKDQHVAHVPPEPQPKSN